MATSTTSGSRSAPKRTSTRSWTAPARSNGAIANVLCGTAEDDEFNQLVLYAGLDMQPVVWLRAWFRYLRQTGSSFGLVTVVDALRRAPNATRALIGLFVAAHDPSAKKRDEQVAEFAEQLDRSLAKVRSIDDDRILRRLRALVEAIVRTNAFAPAAEEALAFKINSSMVPGLPAPVPWREIWVYSPRVEGIHLRGGPVARGGIRWSDRRDDFRTEILGLMKAQVVKNAVIVPTGAKGGFYPKQLPPISNRDALARRRDRELPDLHPLAALDHRQSGQRQGRPSRAASSSTTATILISSLPPTRARRPFPTSPTQIALERNFWLGDAFASGGSNGYDHKAMGITAKGAWISVQRHFLEMGVDVQTDAVTVAGCGDMSGDVFGNGMLLSKSIRLIAAFDHRHIFIDPNPDPAKSWEERKRMFELPRSSWDDYDRKLISKGGGVFPRTEKSISLSAEAREALGIDATRRSIPRASSTRSSRAPVDLLWFGGIGTYIKSSAQSKADVGDPSNDALRASANELRAKVIGEGANLGITQAGRIEFAERGGRINTDFIDNSAGVDCSDNEVNIKIPLNREMREGRLEFDKRNILLAKMTDDVAEIVLEDNRLQTLALSIAEAAEPRRSRVRFARSSFSKPRAGSTARSKGLERARNCFAAARRIAASRGRSLRSCSRSPSSSSRMRPRSCELAEDPLVGPQLFDAFPKAMRKAQAGRDPRPPAAQRDHRDQGRQPARQPARSWRRLRPHRGRRRVAPAGRRRLPRRRASARPRQTVDGDRTGRAFPKPSASSSSRSPRRASARTSPTSFAPAAARPGSQSSARCSSRASARFPPPRPSSSARRSRTRRRPAATG